MCHGFAEAVLGPPPRRFHGGKQALVNKKRGEQYPAVPQRPITLAMSAIRCDLVENPQATPTGFEPVLQA